MNAFRFFRIGLVGFLVCFGFGFVPESANIEKLRKEIIAQRKLTKEKYDHSSINYRQNNYNPSNTVLSEPKSINSSSRDLSGAERVEEKINKEAKLSYWLKFFLVFVFILGLWAYLYRLSVKYGYVDPNKNKDGARIKRAGFSFVELMIAMAIFVVVLSAISALYRPVKILFDKLNEDLEDISTAQQLNYLMVKSFSGVCEDNTHKVEISNNGESISFYVCQDDGAEGVDFIGPISFYLSGGKLMMEKNGITHIVSENVSSLQFSYDNDKIIIYEKLKNGSEFFSQVAVRTCE